jgi:hypothetical protein
LEQPQRHYASDHCNELRTADSDFHGTYAQAIFGLAWQAQSPVLDPGLHQNRPGLTPR